MAGTNGRSIAFRELRDFAEHKMASLFRGANRMAFAARSKERMETRCFEVPIVGKRVGNAQSPHHCKRYVIHDAGLAGHSSLERNPCRAAIGVGGLDQLSICEKLS